jgi:hypothetical protein
VEAKMARVMRVFRSAAAFVRKAARFVGEARMRQREAEEFGEIYSPYGWP